MLLIRFKRWILCFVVIAALLSVWVMPRFWSASQPSDVPYGVVGIPGTNFVGTQDFAYHINYLHQIWRKSVAHPYRPAEQERIVKAWQPRASMGFPHAYSPVTLVIALPLLAIPAEWAFVLFTFFNAVALILLTCLYLLPRIKNPVQAGAVAAVFCSYVLFDTFIMGQTSIATTCIIATGYAFLQKRALAGNALLGRDFVLGALLFFLSMKPSVAIILGGLLLAERAWRALLTTTLGLALTWISLAPYYGGYTTGLQDFSWLLNHYCQADMPPFMQPGLPPAISASFSSYLTMLCPAWGDPIFQFSRFLFEGLMAYVIFAYWRKWIDLSTLFQGLLWIFLLFSPYLLITEDLALCLLVVEGDFFRWSPGAPIKIVLVLLLVNMRMSTWNQLPLLFPIKLTLAGWWLLDQIILPRLGNCKAPKPRGPSAQRLAAEFLL